ncbi:MAG: hypothetical protein OEX19_16625 [Gammaproteobacteria bacterium]|nr:hypothetical protein [Gammaproteobacteria bacterium]
MENEKIKLVTEKGQEIEALVYSKNKHNIEVVVGEGVHSVRCTLTPTPNGSAYVGNLMGRELIFKRTPDEVQADIDNANPELRRSSRTRQ